MERRNRYRNQVGVSSVLRVVFICFLIGLMGGGFVFLRNRHVKTGDQIRAVELHISEMESEEQLWELRIAGAKDRIEMARRLKWMGSDLQPIDPARVLKIATAEPVAESP